MAAPAPSSFNLRSILEKEKLTGTNFMDWYRNLRIVLRQEHKEFVLTQPFPADLPNNASAAQRREHEKRCNDYLDISCLMLATMSPELQSQYEALDAHTIITGLRNMFEDQARAERFNTSKSLFACRLVEGPAKDAECFFCKEADHWKRNCKKYLEQLKQKQQDGKSSTSVYNINAKRQRPNDLNPTFIWHCHLGHINEKRMEKLHRDGLLHSFDFESFETCESCLLGKMTKAPFTGQSERASELLGLVYTDECGIVPQLTPPGTPQWNGVSERRNRTLLDMVRSMMSQTDLPLSFWGYALETAAFTLNRVPSKSLDKTPYEIWTGKRPSLSFLKIWGCEVYVKRLQSDKLTPKSDKYFFVGYPKETKGYYFYNREEDKVFVARHDVFLEKEFISTKDSGIMVRLEEIQETPKNASTSTQPQQDEQDVVQQVEQVVVEPVVEAPASRRSERIWRTPARYALLTTGQRDILLLDNDKPTTYEEAMVGPDSKKWLGAMKSEIESMHVNQVWNLVDPPDGVKGIECKWVFKKKTDLDGNVHIYKARLVAKGFRQIQSVDYDGTFSSVGMLKSIRIILAIPAYFDYEIWQMDVKTAFLNENLDEDKSIYGLKQASRSWNIRFDEVVKALGFVKNEEEPCVYKKISGSALDLREAAYILSIRIYRDRSRRLIGSQSTYIDKVLKRFNMQDSKKGFLPLSHGINLGKNQCPQTTDERNKMSVIPYASAIGSIMYAMLCTRPDVPYALSATSQYQSDPGESHWIAVKNILKYLRRTKDMFLIYGGQEELVVNNYTDASFQTDKDDFRSQSGFVFCLNGGAVSWKSSKQDTVADSTTEAEYIAASEAAKEAAWIKKFVSQLGVMTSASSPMDLYCDNSGAIAQAKEPRSHRKSKHILRRYHLIREIVGRGDVKICKIHTDLNVVDPLTKPLPRPKHETHCR
uniref:Retrotransposon protein, putative, Ty1-copia subclass n=1 Tax=Oryza sativa subsp. japonica TaxID=39947 RepID=H2KWP6_ORYSJ|nr:retrotransposon protein, putative, Ty1-copia subclass [Oryza sativa Japonica Group]